MTSYIRFGSSDNAIGYDETVWSSAIETDQPIKAGPPVEGDDVMRLDDVYDPVVDLLTSRAWFFSLMGGM